MELKDFQVNNSFLKKQLQRDDVNNTTVTSRIIRLQNKKIVNVGRKIRFNDTFLSPSKVVSGFFSAQFQT